MKFKPNYLNMLIVFMSLIMFSVIPIVIIIIDIFEKRGITKIFENILFGIAIELVSIILLAIVCGLINFIINLFSKTYTELIEDEFVYSSKKCRFVCKYDDVSKIYYDIGTISRVHSTPATLSIFKENGLEFKIKNPSFLLMITLKKKCKNAVMTTNYYKWLGFNVIISIVVGIFISLFG